MASATLHGTVIAKSEDVVEVEGDLYFPPDTVNMDYLEPSQKTYNCPWRGLANYFHVRVGGKQIENAAFRYSNPSPKAKAIKGRFAFRRGIKVEK